MSSLFPPKPIPEDQSSLWSTVQALHWVQRVLAPLLLSRCAEPSHQRQPHLPLGTLAKSSSGADSPSPETPLAQSPAERSSPRGPWRNSADGLVSASAFPQPSQGLGAGCSYILSSAFTSYTPTVCPTVCQALRQAGVQGGSSPTVPRWHPQHHCGQVALIP